VRRGRKKGVQGKRGGQGEEEVGEGKVGRDGHTKERCWAREDGVGGGPGQGEGGGDQCTNSHLAFVSSL
jgi:hypothetical protein